MTLRLSKHHGLGNDFLVLIGPADQLGDVDADLAVRLCDRHRGVGADGLLVGVLPPSAGGDADLTMTLYNADGGVAEMSGNGIRCLAQAEAQRRGTDHVDLRIATDGGPRPVQVRPGGSGDPATVHEARISVSGRTIPEKGIGLDELENFVVAWPGEKPGRRIAAALKRSRARK